MKTHKPSVPARAGFSLVEMLVVIALIGVIASIAVNQVSEINGAGHNAKNMRNAQNLASIYQSAQAAGLNFYDPDLATVVGSIAIGGTVTDATSPFNGAYFGLPEMSADEILGAQTYLTIDPASEGLLYDVNVIP